MQLLGTEAGREVIHPDIWVNAMFADYQATKIAYHEGNYAGNCKKCGFPMQGVDKRQVWCKACCNTPVFPDWIIPDMRFPNELRGVQQRSAVTIRVNRPIEMGFVVSDGDKAEFKQHPSETSLDDFESEFDYIIDNDLGLKELLEKVKRIWEAEIQPEPPNLTFKPQP